MSHRILFEGTRTTRIALTLVGVALALGSGCARPDWIQQTLVTVDVTGTWVGSTMPRLVGVSAYDVRLGLEQEGAKVKGTLVFIGGAGGTPPGGPIEGTVGGDVLRFEQKNRPLVGEMTVSGDEMKGSLTIGTPLPITLRRIDTSSVPRSQ